MKLEADEFSKRSIFFSGCGGLAGLCISKTSFPMPPAVKFKGRTCRVCRSLVPPNSRVALAEVVGMPNSNASDYATVSQQATQCFQLSKVQNYRCLIACRPCFGSNCTFLMQKLNKVTGACVQISTQANKKFISWKNRPRISRG